MTARCVIFSIEVERRFIEDATDYRLDPLLPEAQKRMRMRIDL
jgi:hypothetical protein